MLVQEEEEEVGDVEEVGEEERMENLEEGQLKIGEQVEKYDLRYDSETDTASSSFGDGDEERSVECGEENTTMLEMEVQGEEEILCVKKKEKRGSYKKRKFKDLSYHGKRTRLRQKLRDVDKDELEAMYSSLQRKDKRYKTNIPRRMSVLYLTKIAGISQRKLDIIRMWIKKSIKNECVDLAKIPCSRHLFEKAKETMLPPGIVMEPMTIRVPLQSLLDTTTVRYNFIIHIIFP